MSKGYWIAAITIHEPAGYAEYQAAMRLALEAFGGRYLVRGGKAEAMEGNPRSRAVVIEFADYATALACYHSPQMVRARQMRQRLADTDLLIVEGWDGAY